MATDVNALNLLTDSNKQRIIIDISQEMKVKEWQIEATLTLLNDGNTVPFIARYRKEATGSLDETQIRTLQESWQRGIDLLDRKSVVLKSIAEQGKLTDELQAKIINSTKITQVEDLYLPFKPKKRTKGMIAREKGLEPLALLLLAQQPLEKPLEELAQTYVDAEKELADISAVLEGVRHIIAEDISDTADIREKIRTNFFSTVELVSRKSSSYEMDIQENNQERIVEGRKYENYFEYKEKAFQSLPHRVLAINRGDKEGFLFASCEFPEESVIAFLIQSLVTTTDSAVKTELQLAISDSWKRLLGPSLGREVRQAITEQAEIQAIKVFKENLRNLLLQPPMKQKRIIGVDPGFRTGCKIVIIDEMGQLLDTGVIYPHEPQKEWEKAKDQLLAWVNSYQADLIAIGNGTASRETEKLASEVCKVKQGLAYAIVSESGASIYSASKEAIEEFPNYDVTVRGAISIARRLLDPLAELVKIDPRSIGVGQYQHDMPKLKQELETVVESVVNLVGVNLNTASYQLLSYVSGLTKTTAKNIVEFRVKNGKFTNRTQLNDVSRLGPKTFEQCAGFLRIPESESAFDNTPVHPESYELAQKILLSFGVTEADLRDNNTRKDVQSKLSQMDIQTIITKINALEKKETVIDIIKVLQNPFRDPRDDYPMPTLRSDVLTMEDLKEGMELEGRITNVTDFGAFVDIGLKQSGLIHLSQLADRFVKHPSEVVKVGDIVKVHIMSIDKERERIGLSMKKNDSSKKPTGSSQPSQVSPKPKKPKFQKPEDKQLDDLFKGGKLKL